MRIHLVKKRNIDLFVENHRLSSSAFYNWIAQLKRVDCKNPQDIVESFNHADLLGGGSKRIVFNIGGNKYRMICTYYFGLRKVHLYICWIGTHVAYTKLCRRGQQYTVN